MSEYSNSLIRGTINTLILKVLEDNDKMYGYQLSKEVSKRTSDKITLTEGAMYPALHKLEKNGLIQSEESKVDNRIRKYYRLTESGRKATTDKTLELLDFMRTMASFIKYNT